MEVSIEVDRITFTHWVLSRTRTLNTRELALTSSRAHATAFDADRPGDQSKDIGLVFKDGNSCHFVVALVLALTPGRCAAQRVALDLVCYCESWRASIFSVSTWSFKRRISRGSTSSCVVRSAGVTRDTGRFDPCVSSWLCDGAISPSAGGGFARPTREDALAATSVEQLTWWDGSDIDATAVPLDCPPALIFDWEWPDGCVPFYQVVCVRARAYTCMHMHPSVHLSIYLSGCLSIYRYTCTYMYICICICICICTSI